METQESIHIGHLIHEQLKADDRSVSWLAREIHCTRNNVYKIFNKPSLDGDLILKISVAMNFNFFQYIRRSFSKALRLELERGNYRFSSKSTRFYTYLDKKQYIFV